MRLPDWAARRQLSLALIATVAAGLLLGWFTTPLPRELAMPHGADTWTPPTAAQIQRFDDHAFQSLLTSAAWPETTRVVSVNGTTSGATAPAWSLIGIVLTPQKVALVLDSASAKVERVTMGEPLPDGATLEKIERDAISVSDAGCRRRIELFRTPQDAGNGACTSPAQAASASPPAPGDSE